MPESLRGRGRPVNHNREVMRWEVSLEGYEISFFLLNMGQYGTQLLWYQKPEQWMLHLHIRAEVPREERVEEITSCFYAF